MQARAGSTANSTVIVWEIKTGKPSEQKREATWPSVIREWSRPVFILWFKKNVLFQLSCSTVGYMFESTTGKLFKDPDNTHTHTHCYPQGHVLLFLRTQSLNEKLWFEEETCGGEPVQSLVINSLGIDLM